MATGFQQWLRHIYQSSYCFRRYGGIFDYSHGQEACPCGWVSHPQPLAKLSLDENDREIGRHRPSDD